MFVINIRIIKCILLSWILYSLINYGMKFLTNQSTTNENEGHFWIFTDTHIDLFYQGLKDASVHCHNNSLSNNTKTNRKFGQFNCDTPLELLHSAFSAARKIDANVDFVIWLGDAASHHDIVPDTTIPAHVVLAQQLEQYFPNTLILPVLGNHDILLKTNRSLRFEEFCRETNFHLLLEDSHARQTFLKGGYYSIRYQSFEKGEEQSYIRFVVLNSVMFQREYVHIFDKSQILEQISWFNQTMSDAYHRNDRILLLIHVPFGIDEPILMKFFDIIYEQQLLAIIDKYSRNIIMCLTGHRHQDAFRLYSSSNTVMGILANPSISPLDFLAEPSIRYYSYDRKSLILYDYDQYILNLIETERTQIDRWILSYRFSTWYNQPRELTSTNLAKLVRQISNDPFYLRRFLLTQHYRGNVTLTSLKIIQTICALTHFDFDGFLQCTNSFKDQHYKYPAIVMNYSLESNVLINERQPIYKNCIYGYMIVIFAVFLGIIYIVFWKLFTRFCTISQNRTRI